MKFENMSEDMKSTEVEHHLQNCAEIFSRLSSRIPKNLQFVAQAIHLELCDAMCFSSDAANTFDKEEKMKCLIDMKYKMQKVYKRTHYLVLTWYESFPEELKRYMAMDNNCNFKWLGEKPLRNRNKFLTLEEEMKYKIIMPNGGAKIVDDPNFIKMNPRYPSFICCGRDDAECVILQEGEESVCYNIAVQRYPEYDVVDVRAV